MTVRILPKSDWQSYCDRISKKLGGTTAHVEVTALDLGDQAATRWVPLIGISYDTKGDILEIALEGLDHLIRAPQQIAVEDGPGGLSSMEIQERGERRQILRLQKPLQLPSH